MTSSVKENTLLVKIQRLRKLVSLGPVRFRLSCFGTPVFPVPQSSVAIYVAFFLLPFRTPLSTLSRPVLIVCFWESPVGV